MDTNLVVKRNTSTTFILLFICLLLFSVIRYFLFHDFLQFLAAASHVAGYFSYFRGITQKLIFYKRQKRVDTAIHSIANIVRHGNSEKESELAMSSMSSISGSAPRV